MNGEPLAGKRVLVTGASGFIASHVVDRLKREGAVVGALSRRVDLLDGSGVTLLPCDVADGGQTKEAFDSFRPEVVYHFASQPDAGESAEQAIACIQVNLTGTLNVIEAFRLCRGRLFLFGDSTKVYGNGPVPYREDTPVAPGSSYAICKAAAWEMSCLYGRLHGFAAVSLRPTLIYGPRQGPNIIRYAIDQMLDGASELNLDGGEQTRDPIFIDDAVDAFIRAGIFGAALDGRVINISGGDEISVRDLARTIAEVVGAQVAIVCHPERARPTELWRSFGDNGPAAELIGWRPRTSLRDGIAATLAFMRAERGCTVS